MRYNPEYEYESKLARLRKVEDSAREAYQRARQAWHAALNERRLHEGKTAVAPK